MRVTGAVLCTTNTDLTYEGHSVRFWLQPETVASTAWGNRNLCVGGEEHLAPFALALERLTVLANPTKQILIINYLATIYVVVPYMHMCLS
jgi:hypothetical protein